MAISLFSLKRSTSSKVTSFIDPTKFGGVASTANKQTLKSKIAEKSILNNEVKELSYIRRSLQLLVNIEKKNFDLVTDSIKKFALSEERRQLREEESLQESKSDKDKKKDSEKNPLVREGKRRIEGFANFLQGLMKLFIGYKILEWAGKPENTKKIENIFNFFKGLFKFIGIVGNKVADAFGSTPIGIVLNNLPKAFELIVNVVKGIADFISFKWLGDTIQGVGKLIDDSIEVFKIIPNAIGSLINFITNLIPNFIESVLTQGLDGSKSELESELNKPDTKGVSSDKATTSTPDKGQKSKSEQIDFGKVFGDSLKGIATTVLENVIPGGALLSNVSKGVSGLFGGKKDKELPKLAKGGIVTKPTQAIVGEAGPEAILPLDKLGSFGIDQFAGEVNKQIPKFIKLLTLPFKIVGAGIVALISSSVSKIPGLGPILMPLISNVASMFGIPPSLVKGMSNFASTAMKTVDQGLTNVKEIFGGKDPKISKTKSDEFKSSGDTTVRGLLGDILSALISKNGSSNNAPPSTTPSPSPDTSSGSPKDTGNTPSIDKNTGAQLSTSGSPIKNTDFAKTQLESTKPKFREDKSSNVLQDVGNKNLQKVTGANPGKYFYDAYGNVYAVDKDEKRILTPADFKAGVGGSMGALYFFRNLNNGTVSISRHADAQGEGWYDYASNAVKELKKGDGSKNNPDRVTWVPATESKKYKSGFSESTPYGKTTLKAKTGTYVPGNTNIDGDRVPILAEPGEYVLNKNLVAAAGGPKALDKFNFGAFPRFENWGQNILKMATGGTVIEYITGDRSHPAYSADHGGGAYHDHLAFKSKAERDSAIKYLEGKGWYVGSRNDGKHASGSYHYSNQAFDIPFYPNDKRKGVSDNQTGETKLSSMLRADLSAGGFKVPGGKGPGGPRENDSGSSGQGTTESATPDWASIATHLGDLFKVLNSSTDVASNHQTTDTNNIDKTSTSPTQKLPPVAGTPPRSAQSLQSAQRENIKLESQRRSSSKPGGTVVPINIPGKTVTESSTQPMIQPLGRTTPPVTQTVYPIAP